MIFYFGVAFCIGGLVILVMLLRKMGLPKAHAIIQEVTMEYHKKDKRQLKTHPHAIISYNHKSVDYKAKIFLLIRKLKVGDTVIVSFKPDSPDKPSMYAPEQELIAMAFIMLLGLGTIAASIFLMDSIDL